MARPQNFYVKTDILVPTAALLPITRSLLLLYPFLPVGKCKPNFGGISGPVSHIGETGARRFEARGFGVPPIRIEKKRHGEGNKAS